MKLFIYDHCPYCVKARMIFGLKAQPVELVTLLNDDEKTPRSMIGQKMVPILEKEPGHFMPESMDIVKFMDEQNPPALVSESEDPALLNILDEANESYYGLTMPRWLNSGMEEFKTPSARKYFQNKKEAMIGPFDQALSNTPHFKKEMERVLSELEKKMPGKNQWYGGKRTSFNDFHLFPFLRGLTVVKGMVFPPLLDQYAKRVSEQTKVPLSSSIAL